MKVFIHHIYEYQKGLRNLVLHTLPLALRSEAEMRLTQLGIDFQIQEVSPTKINVFFGSAECVAIVRKFVHKPLYEFTPEEDFILGIMLGYGRQQQCVRYLERSAKQKLQVRA